MSPPPGNPLPIAAPAVHRGGAMPNRARPPWEGVAAIDLLRRKAPDATLDQREDRFVALPKPSTDDARKAAAIAERQAEEVLRLPQPRGQRQRGARKVIDTFRTSLRAVPAPVPEAKPSQYGTASDAPGMS